MKFKRLIRAEKLIPPCTDYLMRKIYIHKDNHYQWFCTDLLKDHFLERLDLINTNANWPNILKPWSNEEKNLLRARHRSRVNNRIFANLVRTINIALANISKE